MNELPLWSEPPTEDTWFFVILFVLIIAWGTLHG